jgi:hypothetical protein
MPEGIMMQGKPESAGPAASGTDAAAQVQVLIDRAAIHDLHMRYFNGADCARRDVVRDCFTPDVVAQYEGRPSVRGVDALVAQIALFDSLASGVCRISTHFTGNVQYKRLDAGAAETEINAFAFLVQSDEDVVSMRSLRYLDSLRRVEGQWRISARLHTLDWACNVPATTARMFAQKLTDLRHLSPPS